MALAVVSVCSEIDEIKEVYDFIEDRLKPWSQGLAPHFNLLKKDLHWWILPKVVEAFGTFVKLDRRSKLYLAAIFAMLYLADHIHCQVKDDEEGQEHDEKLQFSILIGDYIFGESVKMLGEIEGYHLLGLFSDMICLVNEGHVKNKLAARLYCKVLEAEKASFYRYACLTVACLVGLTPEECRAFEEAGNCLGMAAALHDKQMTALGLEYLEKAKVILSRLLPAGDKGEVFKSLFEELSLVINLAPQVAVL